MKNTHKKQGIDGLYFRAVEPQPKNRTRIGRMRRIYTDQEVDRWMGRSVSQKVAGGNNNRQLKTDNGQ